MSVMYMYRCKHIMGPFTPFFIAFFVFFFWGGQKWEEIMFHQIIWERNIVKYSRLALQLWIDMKQINKQILGFHQFLKKFLPF